MQLKYCQICLYMIIFQLRSTAQKNKIKITKFGFNSVSVNIQTNFTQNTIWLEIRVSILKLKTHKNGLFLCLFFIFHLLEVKKIFLTTLCMGCTYIFTTSYAPLKWSWCVSSCEVSSRQRKMTVRSKYALIH